VVSLDGRPVSAVGEDDMPEMPTDSETRANSAMGREAGETGAAKPATTDPEITPEPAKGTSMSTPPTKPTGNGFVPEIPRRAVDIPGSPVRRPGPPPGAHRNSTEDRRLLVGQNISLSGEITACDSLVVEGTVDAKLENSQSIEITETGTFRGPIRIEQASIAGTYEGDLTVRGTLSVKSTGVISGKVRYGKLEVELGGVIRGDSAPLDEDTDEGSAAE